VNGHGCSARLVLGTLAIAAAVAMLLSGCSDIGFPAIHDMPAPRADTPLTPDQVKQATDNLICERDHLSTEAQAPVAPAGAAANPPAKGLSAAQKPPPPCAPPAAAQTAQPTVTGSTQPPSAYAKP
jgi:hypothetical protein